MILPEGENLLAPVKNPRHHAQAYLPLAYDLIANLFLGSEVGTDPERVHVLLQSRKGPGSFTLYLDSTQYPTAIFSFKPRHDANGEPTIEVRDHYSGGNLIFTIATREDVRTFIKIVDNAARTNLRAVAA